MSPKLRDEKKQDSTQRSVQSSTTQQLAPEPDVTVRDDVVAFGVIPTTDVDESIFSQPAQEEIAVLAYSYWLDEGQPEGSSEEHWFRAEQALRARRNQQSAAATNVNASQTVASGGSRR